MGGWYGRRYGNPDRNQPAIVSAIGRHLHLKAYNTTGVGDDFPDLVLPWRGLTVLVEIKSATGKLTPGQETFRKLWTGGPVIAVRTFAELLAALIELDKQSPPTRPRRTPEEAWLTPEELRMLMHAATKLDPEGKDTKALPLLRRLSRRAGDAPEGRDRW